MSRRNDTHESRTDPDAKLYRKSEGREAKLSYLGHVTIENRNGLIVDAVLTTADGTTEADAALLRAASLRRKHLHGRITFAADKAYDQRELVHEGIKLGPPQRETLLLFWLCAPVFFRFLRTLTRNTKFAMPAGTIP